jgi:hypothetical protein
MTKLLLSVAAFFVFAVTTSVVFAEDATNPVPQVDNQHAPQNNDDKEQQPQQAQ